MLPNPRYFIPAVAAAILLAALLAGIAFGEENFTNEQIVEAIYLAEGGKAATFAYGIRSVRYNSIAEARKICYNTVRNNRRRYANYGHKQYPDYLSFLASKYAPLNVKNDPNNLNNNWLKNLKYFLKKNAKRNLSKN